jgi:hypothetical protein
MKLKELTPGHGVNGCKWAVDCLPGSCASINFTYLHHQIFIGWVVYLLLSIQAPVVDFVFHWVGHNPLESNPAVLLFSHFVQLCFVYNLTAQGASAANTNRLQRAMTFLQRISPITWQALSESLKEISVFCLLDE